MPYKIARTTPYYRPNVTLTAPSMPPSRRPYAVPTPVNNTRALVPKLARAMRTVTKLKKRRLTQKASRDGTGGTFSKFSFKRYKVPRGFGGTTDNYFVTNGSGRFSAGSGVQNAETHGTFFTKYDLNLIASQVSSSDTLKYLLKSCSAELELTNQCKGNVRLKIYDIVARRDLNTSNVQTPSYAWAHNYAQEGGNDSDYTVVGTTPFSNSMFVKFFKISKITNVLLAQGQTHCHKLYFKPNAVINKDTLDEISHGLKGLTRYTMIVAHGCPYNDIEIEHVSTGDVAIDWIVRKQYRYTHVDDSSVNYNVSNQLPVLANVHLMDIGSGEAEADQNA